MSNYFHLLVEVPPKEKGSAVEIADEGFLARLKPLYATVYYQGIEQMLKKFRADGADKTVADLKEEYSTRSRRLIWKNMSVTRSS